MQRRLCAFIVPSFHHGTNSNTPLIACDRTIFIVINTICRGYTKVDTKFRRQVAVAQSVKFARGLRATEFVLFCFCRSYKFVERSMSRWPWSEAVPNRITGLFSFIYEDGLEPSPLLLRPCIGLLYQSWMIDVGDCEASNVMNEWQGKLKHSGKISWVPLLHHKSPTLLNPTSNPGRSGGNLAPGFTPH
jgi:hypothetical protein